MTTRRAFLTEYGSYKEGTEGTAVPRDEQWLFTWWQDVPRRYV